MTHLSMTSHLYISTCNDQKYETMNSSRTKKKTQKQTENPFHSPLENIFERLNRHIRKLIIAQATENLNLVLWNCFYDLAKKIPLLSMLTCGFIAKKKLCASFRLGLLFLFSASLYLGLSYMKNQ